MISGPDHLKADVALPKHALSCPDHRRHRQQLGDCNPQCLVHVRLGICWAEAGEGAAGETFWLRAPHAWDIPMLLTCWHPFYSCPAETPTTVGGWSVCVCVGGSRTTVPASCLPLAHWLRMPLWMASTRACTSAWKLAGRSGGVKLIKPRVKNSSWSAARSCSACCSPVGWAPAAAAAVAAAGPGVGVRAVAAVVCAPSLRAHSCTASRRLARQPCRAFSPSGCGPTLLQRGWGTVAAGSDAVSTIRCSPASARSVALQANCTGSAPAAVGPARCTARRMARRSLRSVGGRRAERDRACHNF